MRTSKTNGHPFACANRSHFLKVVSLLTDAFLSEPCRFNPEHFNLR